MAFTLSESRRNSATNLWEVDVLRNNSDGSKDVMDTIPLTDEVLPPIKNKAGKVIWKLPEDNQQPKMSTRPIEILLKEFRRRRKERKKNRADALKKNQSESVETVDERKEVEKKGPIKTGVENKQKAKKQMEESKPSQKGAVKTEKAKKQSVTPPVTEKKKKKQMEESKPSQKDAEKKVKVKKQSVTPPVTEKKEKKTDTTKKTKLKGRTENGNANTQTMNPAVVTISEKMKQKSNNVQSAVDTSKRGNQNSHQQGNQKPAQVKDLGFPPATSGSTGTSPVLIQNNLNKQETQQNIAKKTQQNITKKTQQKTQFSTANPKRTDIKSKTSDQAKDTWDIEKILNVVTKALLEEDVDFERRTRILYSIKSKLLAFPHPGPSVSSTPPGFSSRVSSAPPRVPPVAPPGFRTPSAEESLSVNRQSLFSSLDLGNHFGHDMNANGNANMNHPLFPQQSNFFHNNFSVPAPEKIRNIFAERKTMKQKIVYSPEELRQLAGKQEKVHHPVAKAKTGANSDNWRKSPMKT